MTFVVRIVILAGSFLFFAGPAPAADSILVPDSVRVGDLFLVRAAPGAVAGEALEFIGNRYPAVEAEPGGEGRFFLLSTDLDTPPGRHEIRTVGEDGVLRRLDDIVVLTREFPVEELTLPGGMVTPPPAVHERIAAERAAAAAVYRNANGTALWRPPFQKPSSGKPKGNFGRRRILNGIPKSPHSGEDYSAPAGSEVRAAARGSVALADDLYYSGNTVLIDHGAGLVSQYFHLETILVPEGSIVERGQVIGLVGATGRVTGPHLHFGIRLYGSRSDPSQLWDLFP